jgi:hypothetical protein
MRHATCTAKPLDVRMDVDGRFSFAINHRR